MANILVLIILQGDSGGAMWALYANGPQYRIAGMVTSAAFESGTNGCTGYMQTLMNGFLPGHNPHSFWLAPYAVKDFIEPIVGSNVWCANS